MKWPEARRHASHEPLTQGACHIRAPSRTALPSALTAIRTPERDIGGISTRCPRCSRASVVADAPQVCGRAATCALRAVRYCTEIDVTGTAMIVDLFASVL